MHGPPFDGRDGHGPVGPGRRPTTSRRPIFIALAIAVATTVGVYLFVGPRGEGAGRAAVDASAPPIVGTTLDGTAFDLAEYRGRPILINFWGPSCVPCRDEFPLFLAKLAEHADDRFAIIGVLTDDPPEPARRFADDFGATWPTVEDPDKALKTAYRVAGRPQTYFVDGDGVIRSIQIGELRDADFERQYARIAP